MPKRNPTSGTYSVKGFEFEGKYYLKMSALHDGITPMYDGFDDYELLKETFLLCEHLI